jgi:hypothetical protein
MHDIQTHLSIHGQERLLNDYFFPVESEILLGFSKAKQRQPRKLLGELARATSDVFFLHTAIQELLTQQIRPPGRQPNDHASGR